MDKIIKEIIEDALWAPTADNMQNWKLEKNEESFTLKIDKEIDVHPLDIGYGCTVLSMGGFCEYLKVSAASRGYKVIWNFDSVALQLEFKLEKDESHQSANLLNSLRERRTDRRPYETVRMDKELKELLLSTTQNFKTNIYFLEKNKKNLIQYLSKTEGFFFNNFESFYATLKWVNLERNSSNDQGMNIENVGIMPVEAIFLKFMLGYKTMLRFMVNLIIKRVLLFKSRMNLKKTGDFILFTVAENEEKASYFEAGRHAIKSWLILTSNELAAQPLSLSSISCLDLLQETRPELVTENSEFFRNGQKLLKDEFGFASNEIPVWMLRVGTATDKTPLVSNRKSIVSSLDNI